MWKIKGIPYIWGPLDIKESFPVNYLAGAGLKINLKERLKNLLNVIQLKTSRRVAKAIKRAEFTVSASSESVKTLAKYFQNESVLINETGCYLHEESSIINGTNYKKTFNILWVGKFDYRKQLGLALQTIAHLNLPDIRFHILGDDQNPEGAFYKAMAVALKIN